MPITQRVSSTISRKLLKKGAKFSRKEWQVLGGLAKKWGNVDASKWDLRKELTPYQKTKARKIAIALREYQAFTPIKAAKKNRNNYKKAVGQEDTPLKYAFVKDAAKNIRLKKDGTLSYKRKKGDSIISTIVRFPINRDMLMGSDGEIMEYFFEKFWTIAKKYCAERNDFGEPIYIRVFIGIVTANGEIQRQYGVCSEGKEDFPAFEKFIDSDSLSVLKMVNAYSPYNKITKERETGREFVKKRFNAIFNQVQIRLDKLIIK